MSSQNAKQLKTFMEEADEDTMEAQPPFEFASFEPSSEDVPLTST